jgi:hypothetical protein
LLKSAEIDIDGVLYK